MKELTIEEKAKAYDEAVEQAKKELNTCGSRDCDAARQIFRLFPEFKENEDEKIRKHIVVFLMECDKRGVTPSEVTEWFAWLEKQKPVEWSEEDENAIEVIQDIIRHSNKIDVNVYTKNYELYIQHT